MSLRQMLFVSVFIINQIYHLPDTTANSCIVLLVVLCALPCILLLFTLLKLSLTSAVGTVRESTCRLVGSARRSPKGYPCEIDVFFMTVDR